MRIPFSNVDQVGCTRWEESSVWQFAWLPRTEARRVLTSLGREVALDAIALL